MKNLKLALENNDLELFKQNVNTTYLEESSVTYLLKKMIKEKKEDFFHYTLNHYLSPRVFWTISKQLVKNNEYDFLKIMIKVYRDSEKQSSYNNAYADEILFHFIEKDDLFFVDYLVTKEKASTKSSQANELTVLNECAKANALKCFDYFISQGKDIHEFQDLSLFSALENKHYQIVELILEQDKLIDEEIATNFFRYGTQNRESLSKKDFLKLNSLVQSVLPTNKNLQNAVNYQHIKRGDKKRLEENLQKGHSPIGDEHYDLMALAIMLRENAIGMAKTLLDYGGELKDTHKSQLATEEKEILENYPRFSKIKQKLEKKFALKGKEKVKKI